MQKETLAQPFSAVPEPRIVEIDAQKPETRFGGLV